MMYFNHNELCFRDANNIGPCLIELVNIFNLLRQTKFEISFSDQFWGIDIGGSNLQSYLYNLSDEDVVKSIVLSIMNSGPWYNIETTSEEIQIEPNIRSENEYIYGLLLSCYKDKSEYVVSLSEERVLMQSRYQITKSNTVVHAVSNFIGTDNLEKLVWFLLTNPFKSMEECLRFAQEKLIGKVVILSSTYKSAEQHEFKIGYMTMCKLLEILYRIEMKNSTNKLNEFKTQTEGYEISDESQATLSIPRYKRQREFVIPDVGKKLFSWHVKIGLSTRIHYYVDRENKIVYIGHCGAHLGIASYR